MKPGETMVWSPRAVLLRRKPYCSNRHKTQLYTDNESCVPMPIMKNCTEGNPTLPHKKALLNILTYFFDYRLLISACMYQALQPLSCERTDGLQTWWGSWWEHQEQTVNTYIPYVKRSGVYTSKHNDQQEGETSIWMLGGGREENHKNRCLTASQQRHLKL